MAQKYKNMCFYISMFIVTFIKKNFPPITRTENM